MSSHQHIPQRIETELGVVYQCSSCGQDITHFTRKLQNLYIKQRFYQGQGQSYTSWLQGIYNTIQTGGIIYIILGGKARGLAIWVFILAWLMQTIFETWLGRQDYKKWKMAQRQTTLSASYTPITAEMYGMIRELHQAKFPDKQRPNILDQITKK